jgi:hypothetical protein
MTAGVLDQSDVDEFPPFDPDSIEETPEPPKRTRKPRDPNAPPRTRVTANKKLAQELLKPTAMLAQAVGHMLPTVGAVIIARGEVTTNALVAFSETHPKMRKALQSISSVAPGADLVQTLAMIIIAVNIDIGRLDGDSPIATLTGVGAIHEQIVGHLREQEPGVHIPENTNGGFGNFDMPAPTIPQPPPMYWGDTHNDDGTFSAPPVFSAGAGAAVRNP